MKFEDVLQSQSYYRPKTNRRRGPTTALETSTSFIQKLMFTQATQQALQFKSLFSPTYGQHKRAVGHYFQKHCGLLQKAAVSLSVKLMQSAPKFCYDYPQTKALALYRPVVKTSYLRCSFQPFRVQFPFPPK